MVNCIYFAKGSCFKGTHCEYSHDTNHPECTFSQTGVCAYGSQCRYAHAETSARTIPGHSSEALRVSIDKECNICKERVVCTSDQKFGILLCDHIYCYACITKWRFNVRGSYECPYCKLVSPSVVPSAIWYSSEEEKNEIINSYWESLRRIDCYWFKFGAGHCRFGDRCYYKHDNRVNPEPPVLNAQLNPDTR